MLLMGASRFSPRDESERPATTTPTPMLTPAIGDDELAPLAEAALSASLPSSDAALDFPLGGHFRSLSDGGAPSLGLGGVTHANYDALHLSLGGYRDEPFLPRSLARESRRRRTDPVYVRGSSAFPSAPSMPTLAQAHASSSSPSEQVAVPTTSEHDRRKKVEREELIEMILESVASVPMALEKIHTNPRLRAALEQEIGGGHARLHRFFKPTSVLGDARFGASEDDDMAFGHGVGWGGVQATPLDAEPQLSGNIRSDDNGQDIEDEEDDDDHDSSDYDSEYENDLAEAVNQLVMTEATLSSAERQISAPILINKHEGIDQTSNRASNSPQSSIFGASPGTYSQDGEPTAALWPRQPHQFAFTQEEEEEVGARVQDEVYSEMVGSMGEDENFLEEEEGGESHMAALEKIFEMDDGSEDTQEMNYRHAQRVLDTRSPTGTGEVLNGFSTPVNEVLAIQGTGVLLGDGKDDDDEEESDNDEEDGDEEYEVFELRVFREKERTGFEANEDWRPRIGSLVGARYRVQMEIGEAVFSRTYKGVDTLSGEAVCLKIIKNSKEYFDQGIDEIRVLQYIDAHCDVDEMHLVRLQDFFYFREHLVIVTELLRDNLYEFSKLLLERGNINYFSMPRLKKVAIEVLEALDTLHSLGLVHCDLKPENILISNFNECRVKVIDFGSACFVTDELTSYVQSRSYRAPEVILGLGYDQKIDLWSLGCVLAELFTGEVLFKNDSEQSLLERIIGAIGPIPYDLLLENSELDVQFTENPAFAMDPATGNGVLSPLHVPLPTLEALVQTSDAAFLDFLRALLQIHPTERASASEALRHPWLQRGVFSRSASQ